MFVLQFHCVVEKMHAESFNRTLKFAKSVKKITQLTDAESPFVLLETGDLQISTRRFFL